MLKHVHRRFFSEGDFRFLHQIGYVITEDGLVDIIEVRLHTVDQNKIIGENIIHPMISQNLPYELRLAALDILVEEGIISIP